VAQRVELPFLVGRFRRARADGGLERRLVLIEDGDDVVQRLAVAHGIVGNEGVGRCGHAALLLLGLVCGAGPSTSSGRLSGYKPLKRMSSAASAIEDPPLLLNRSPTCRASSPCRLPVREPGPGATRVGVGRAATCPSFARAELRRAACWAC